MQKMHGNELLKLYLSSVDPRTKISILKLMKSPEDDVVSKTLRCWAKGEMKHLEENLTQEAIADFMQRVGEIKFAGLGARFDEQPSNGPSLKEVEKEIVSESKAKAEAEVESLTQGIAPEPKPELTNREKARSRWYQGYQKFDDKKYEEAIRLYNQSQVLDPMYAPPVNSLGRIAMNDKKLTEAERLFRKAQQLDAGYSPASYNLALVLAMQKKKSEAQGEFRRALRKWPDYPYKSKVEAEIQNI